MSKYKCIIFDCDGVLVDSEPIANQVMVEMANDLGASIDLDYAYKYFKGNSLQNCIQHLSKITNESLPITFEKDYRKRSFEAFKSQIKPVDGIEEVLKKLQIPFCVASSGPENKIELNLKLTGLFDYFQDNIFSCYTIKKWKPSPEVFLWAAKTMGYKPEECLVIEDSLIGVTAAKNGGFDVYGFTQHDYNNELENHATRVFSQMPNILKMLYI